MANSNKIKLNNLLKKGALSGFEVAKLSLFQAYEFEKVVYPELFGLKDYDYERDLKQALILGSDETESIKYINLEGNSSKINEFNGWINAHDSFILIIYSAHILYLRIKNLLSTSTLIAKFSLGLSLGLLVPEDSSTPQSKIVEHISSIMGEKIKESPNSVCVNIMLSVKYLIALFLFRKCLAKVLTEETGINYSQQPDFWYENIQSALKSYERTLKNAKADSEIRKYLSGVIETINMDEIDIPSELEEKFREALTRKYKGHEIPPLNIWSKRCEKYFNEEMTKRDRDGLFSYTISFSKNDKN